MNLAKTIGTVCLLLALVAGIAVAQNSKSETHLRTVSGQVTNKSEDPVPGSVVFLKNVRTSAVSSRFADKDGNYKFSGLDPNADYELHAEMGDMQSSVKTMFSLDSRKEMTLNLKLDKKKSSK
ncbi:MAG: carboxypeptidase-like regulatory domain-containing protein [Candidatus Acidiferrum sp.]